MQTEDIDLQSVNLNPNLIQIGRDSTSLSSAAKQITSEIKSHVKASTAEETDDQHGTFPLSLTTGLPDSVLSQLHLTHSSSVEFLRQFWLTYLSRTNPP